MHSASDVRYRSTAKRKLQLRTVPNVAAGKRSVWRVDLGYCRTLVQVQYIPVWYMYARVKEVGTVSTR